MAKKWNMERTMRRLKRFALFGVWQEKKMAGRTYMGTVRTTFIADEQGTIIHIINKVNTKDSANQILEALQAL